MINRIQNLIDAFSDRHKECAFCGNEEIYKWELIVSTQNANELEITKALRGKNIIDNSRVDGVFKSLVNQNAEGLYACIHHLLDENVSLRNRILSYKKEMKELCPSDWKLCANDERTAAAILTCKYPERYTFYKDEIYQLLCAYLEIPKLKAGEKYVHFMELIRQIANEYGGIINSIIKNEIKEFAIQPENLAVQTMLWCMKDYMTNPTNETAMQTEYRMPDPIVKTAKKLLDNAGQIILQGAPGCGKTYITNELAVYLCDGQVPASRAALKARYKELESEGRIGFTTFHQSLDYEEFVEGMKPDTENTEMRFVVKPGIFKRMCERASMGDAPHILIIDEINRANISKVLGELITLIEKTKRIGAEDEFCVTLPYSGERFGVPQNLYIIGTMNTADRSLGYIDYAIRRRFAFLPLKSEWAVVRDFYGDRGELMNRQHELYTRIRNLVKDHLNEDFLLDDVMIGHSYFLAATEDDYRLNLDYKIRPLLEEYLRDGILVEDGTVKETIKNLR